MTPKTLDKYIAALKKKAAAGGWTVDQYQKELDKIKNEMAQQYLDNKITSAEYTKVSKQLDNATKNPGLLGKPKPAAQTAMTADEKNKLLHGLQTKAINKEISKADADKLMDKVDELYGKGVTAEDAQKLLDHATALVKAGFDADAAFGAAESVAKQNKALGIGAQSPQKGMTPDEYSNLEKALDKKKKAGLISQDEYAKLKGKLAEAYQKNKKASEIEKEIGCDPGTLATDQSIIKLGKELKDVYGQAASEMQTKLDDYLKKVGPEIKDLEMKFINGTITEDELKHLKLMTLQKNVLGQKVDQLTGVMLNANQKAMGMINGEQLHVFAENANWQSYQLTQDAKLNLMFSVYDEHTVEKLIKDKPELLPRKEVNGKKDKAWNQKQIANAVTQAVIQGDSIPAMAKRIAVQTGETNMKAMTRYARTAMTSAQNSGRMEMLHKAKGMGIQCKKVWLATLDGRTRDAHGDLDGQKVDVDDDFQSDFGPIKFPGDLSSKGSVPANIYNCRCTLIYDYDGFPNDPAEDQRISYDEYYTEETDADGKKHKVFHRESKLIQDMSYGEWKAAKGGSKLNELNAAKYQLAEAQKAVVKAGVKEDKVYEGLWKDPVTLKDYPAKKAGIQAKRDYYDQEIQKYQDAQAMGASWATDDKIKDLEKKKKLLNEYEKRGELVEKRDNALKAVQDIYDQVGFKGSAAAPAVAKNTVKKSKKAAAAAGGANTGAAGQTGAGLNLSTAGEKKTPFTPDAYSKERKDKALWTTNKAKVDSMMRARTGEVWAQANQAEKNAIYDYTVSYSKFNEPLRGIEYGTSRYMGVGNTDLNAGYKKNGKQLNAMTDIIGKCSYDHDMWLQRGCGWGGMDKFLQCDMNLLQRGTQKQLQNELMGKTITEYGFMSMGSAKGQGFSGNIMFNVYAPAGTKMMYAEPFSAYGRGAKSAHWDGKSTQSGYGSEFETIMQQNTQFRITKVERSGSQLYIDIEVTGQSEPQRWKGR